MVCQGIAVFPGHFESFWGFVFFFPSNEIIDVIATEYDMLVLTELDVQFSVVSRILFK